ncbi:MAG: hypothetical protein JO336_13160 [Acidobacteriia bacterium]|nr:hypothetical protein [Terriglobia bacterium]
MRLPPWRLPPGPPVSGFTRTIARATTPLRPRMLATRGEIPAARFEFEQAIRLKPNLAEARVDFGRFLEDRGELPAAIRELETALRLEPGLWRGHFELAMALGRSGNPAAAIPHLKIAAQGTDAQVRADALDVLHKLGQ